MSLFSHVSVFVISGVWQWKRQTRHEQIAFQFLTRSPHGLSDQQTQGPDPGLQSGEATGHNRGGWSRGRGVANSEGNWTQSCRPRRWETPCLNMSSSSSFYEEFKQIQFNCGLLQERILLTMPHAPFQNVLRESATMMEARACLNAEFVEVSGL